MNSDPFVPAVCRRAKTRIRLSAFDIWRRSVLAWSDRMGGEMSQPPLFDVRVLEVGNYIAGPYCGMQLADLGAEVIKIEQPDGGDQVRLTAPFVDGESSPFVRLNRNKRSLVLDLKAAEGKEIFKRLVREADVVVENLRPGTMKELGLDYQGVLQKLNPR